MIGDWLRGALIVYGLLSFLEGVYFRMWNNITAIRLAESGQKTNPQV